MSVAKKIGIGVLLLILLVVIGLMIWEPMSVDRRAPPPERSYDVEIVRDDWGVPHIFGPTDADVAYGVAWAHSEDDFSTIEQVAAMTRGRAAAILGEEGAQIDYVYHLLDVDGTIAREYDAIPADTKAMLDGYAAGLNAYAEVHPEEVRLDKLFPVDGRDIAAGFVLRSPFFFGLGDVIGALVSGEPLPVEGGPALDASSMMTPVGRDASLNGSNAFAVAPGRSDDGVTRLVSNAHQPWRGQVAWYELVVESGEGLHFAGATFPGSPFPFLGHNENLGWTNTVNRPDLIDVYQLVLDDSGDNYRLDGEWLPLEKTDVVLPVKMGPLVLPVTRTVWRSRHGPVIRNDEGAFAIRYAGIGEARMIEQYYRMPKARDFDEWQRVMAIQGVPATNFVYADKAGNIGLFYNALFPNRTRRANWRGVLPGDRGDLIWQGFVPWEDIPRNVNPGSGYIMNANNTPFIAAGPGDEIDPASVSPLLGVELGMTNRARRAIDLFEATGPVSRQDLYRIKYDRVYSKASYAGTWMRRLLAVDPGDDSEVRAAQALLKRWDWTMDGEGDGDALALVLLRPAMRASYKSEPMPDPREELNKATAYLSANYGTLDPPLGTVLRLRQGDVDLPLDGGSDTLRASTLWDESPDDQRLLVRHGDSFLMFVEWPDGAAVRSRSIQPYGAATTRPASPHYADQATLFVEKRTKPVYFTRESLEGHVERRYRPGQ